MSLTEDEIAEYAIRFRKKSEEPLSKMTLKQYQRNLEVLAKHGILQDVFTPDVFLNRLGKHVDTTATLTLYVKSVMKLLNVMNEQELRKAWPTQQDFSYCHINGILSKYKRFMANHIQNYKQHRASAKTK